MSHPPEPRIRAPRFTEELVADQLNDGYWTESPDIDNDGKPDLTGHGLALGEIYWYQNPDWKRRLIADGIHMPIGGHHADINGNGLQDFIVCYELYGAIGRIEDPDQNGGKIDWIENPGNPQDTEEKWKRHYIGRMVGMHRLRVGHFTRRDKPQLMGLPCVGAHHVHGLIPVCLFTPGEDVEQEWDRTIVDDTYFRMIHGAEIQPHPVPGCDLDSVLLASEEGITWLYFDENAQRWERKAIGAGEHSQFEHTGFKGSGDNNIGRIGDDPFAYVAATEPFHGNTVAVYIKDTPGADPLETEWHRVVLDVYGDTNEHGEGQGHQIVCADFDGDGDDEFLVALRGPYPWQGVMYYKAIDLENGIFTKWRVSSHSVARIATGDFDGSGTLDFATIAYKVDNYFVAENAKMWLFRNETPGAAGGSGSG